MSTHITISAEIEHEKTKLEYLQYHKIILDERIRELEKDIEMLDKK